MQQSAPLLYKRVLLKLSGEALMGDKGYGLDPQVLDRLSDEIHAVYKMGVQICLVIGGGNIFRGVAGASQGMDRASADYMGMLATIMNAVAFQHALEKKNIPTRVLSAIPITPVCEPYIHRRALDHLEMDRVIIFAAGTGNPYFTTDTAATLRAAEMGCDIILKGTQVDGVYTADPKQDPQATRYDKLEYAEVLAKNLKVMDATAIALARETNIPIVVFSIHKAQSFSEIVSGKGVYTWVGPNK